MEEVKQSLAFKDFLHKLENEPLEVKEKTNGTATIQQTTRNQLREEGVAALLDDLTNLYGDEFDIVETADGICFVAENEESDITITWELKSTIKSIDYDPFVEANRYDEMCAEKAAKKEARNKEKAEKEELVRIKRAQKLAEIEARNNK